MSESSQSARLSTNIFNNDNHIFQKPLSNYTNKLSPGITIICIGKNRMQIRSLDLEISANIQIYQPIHRRVRDFFIMTFTNFDRG